ncbi:cell division protein SepF [Streptococcus sp. DD13]|uniref:cell division protein SepF n=1 Tax=Streptococcus sp. DD13 TaxID=1777881 RepID=UPI000795E96A|nr:cell division protein SepF [Streptococcus sp. DD13]KXT79290.1 FtsZ-interacting protein [Streptococcus sp. DD13]
MALKDRFKSFISYFEIDDDDDYEEVDKPYQLTNDRTTTSSRPQRESGQKPVQDVPRSSQGSRERGHSHDSSLEQRRPLTRSQASSSPSNLSRSERLNEHPSTIQRLHERQQELMTTSVKSTIDIKFPRQYDDAREIVNLLIDNISVLIDFQYMTEAQARRCLDYLDGARSVLAGNLKKVSNTMWLLAPVNVVVNIEDLKSARSNSFEGGDYDFDMPHRP